MQKLIVIPARGGSKGIVGKNIYPINGKPLLSYTLEMVEKAKLDDVDVVVSTDSEEIKNIALNYKFVEVVDRPEDISGDNAKTEYALLHAVNVMEARTGKKYHAVITLQPTSPLRTVETFKRFISNYEACYPKYDAMLSLNENRTDFWIRNKDGSFKRRDASAPRRRQEREPLYAENSAYYITEVQALKETLSVLGKKCNGFIISDEEAVDINEPVDILIAESMLKYKNHCKQ